MYLRSYLDEFMPVKLDMWKPRLETSMTNIMTISKQAATWHPSFPDTLPKSRNRDAAATVTAAEIEWSVPTMATCRFRGRRKRSVEAEKQPPSAAAAESSSSVRAASLGRPAPAKMLISKIYQFRT